MTLGLILVWIAGVVLMAGLIELWCYFERTASHGLLQVFLEVGAVFAFFTPLALALVPGALVWGLVRLSSPVFPRVIKPVVRWVFRIARRDGIDPVIEHLVAAHERIHRDKQEIERAMQTNPGDPALLGRIEKLTAEVESTDRAVLGRLNRPAAQAFGTAEFERETPPLWRRLWQREDRPKLPPWYTVRTGLRRSLTGLVSVGILLLVLTGIVYVAMALTQGRHQPSHGSAETTFRAPGSSGYESSEIVSMVEHKAREEGIFSPALESITCPEGTYAVDALVTCTLHSPKGDGTFDVEVTTSGISIKVPGEAK
jgi:hypothetical protein